MADTHPKPRPVEWRPTAFQKWVMTVCGGIAVCVCIGTGTLLLDYRSFRENWQDAEPDIKKNTEFRLRGDRVTPADLDAGMKEASEAFQRTMENQTKLIAEMIAATNNINRELINMGVIMTRVETQIDSMRDEQDRARNERDELRKRLEARP